MSSPEPADTYPARLLLGPFVAGRHRAGAFAPQGELAPPFFHRRTGPPTKPHEGEEGFGLPFPVEVGEVDPSSSIPTDSEATPGTEPPSEISLEGEPLYPRADEPEQMDPGSSNVGGAWVEGAVAAKDLRVRGQSEEEVSPDDRQSATEPSLESAGAAWPRSEAEGDEARNRRREHEPADQPAAAALPSLPEEDLLEGASIEWVDDPAAGGGRRAFDHGPVNAHSGAGDPSGADMIESVARGSPAPSSEGPGPNLTLTWSLEFAARLERIAQVLREHGPVGALTQPDADPLTGLITGYLLGSAESRGNRGDAGGG